MLQEKFTRLDDLAGPNGYAAPPTSEDLAYVIHFRRICRRYNIMLPKLTKMSESLYCGWLRRVFIRDEPDPDSDPEQEASLRN